MSERKGQHPRGENDLHSARCAPHVPTKAKHHRSRAKARPASCERKRQAVGLERERPESEKPERPRAPDDRQIPKAEEIERRQQKRPNEAGRARCVAVAFAVREEVSARETLGVLKMNEGVVEGDGRMAALQENAANRVDRQARGDDDERCIGQGSFHGRSIRAFRSVSQRNASRAIHPGVELPEIHPRLKYAGAPRMPEDARVDVTKLLEGPCKRIEIEVGPGRGGFMMDRLSAREDVGIVGLEVKRKWVTIVNERLGRAGLATRGQVSPRTPAWLCLD